MHNSCIKLHYLDRMSTHKKVECYAKAELESVIPLIVACFTSVKLNFQVITVLQFICNTILQFFAVIFSSKEHADKMTILWFVSVV